MLLEHASARRETNGDRAFLFTGRDGGIINPSSFGRNVWKPAVEQMFGGTEFTLLRKHDLRHAACSAWLSAGVPFKIAQSWSGHKNLSVFLNIYQGVVVGQEEDGVAKLNAWVDTQTTEE